MMQERAMSDESTNAFERATFEESTIYQERRCHKRHKSRTE